MSNYQIISDPEALREFIEWLPDLKEGEKFYFCLFARNKYCKELVHIKSDKQQLKRGTSDKDRFYEKINQLSCPLGAYTQKEIAIPQEALALYMTVNPRSERKAAGALTEKLTKLFVNGDVRVNPYQEALSELQRSCSRKIFTIFDIDSKEQDLDDTGWQIRGILGPEADFSIIETRGGYHILVKANTVGSDRKESWFKNILKLDNLDISKNTEGKYQTDIMIPIPGCTQGGFTPKLFK